VPNKYYIRGAKAEREAKELLEGEGFEVFRTAGSHGRADLIAVKPLGCGDYHWIARLVQVKTCEEKDLKKYKREYMEGIELWIKVLRKGWEIIT